MREILLGLPQEKMDPYRKKCGEKFPYMGLKSTSRNLREEINLGNQNSRHSRHNLRDYECREGGALHRCGAHEGCEHVGWML